MLNRLAAIAVIASALWSTVSEAHFQLLYTPDLLRDKGGQITLKMPFSHPGSNGHVMDMPKPENFYVVHKETRRDLSKGLAKIQWSTAENTGTAWQSPVKLRGLGDFVFVLEPAPYYEGSEDKYIQQITKTIVNVGSLPTDWDAELGLKAELVPLTRPYAIYTGSTFSAVVKANGKPVPFAEIEVEYMNFSPDMAKNAFAKPGLTTAPADAFVTQSIHADASGAFTFGIPRAGFWGFAALGIGPDEKHRGKPLSQDAVIWVQARDMK